MSDFQTPTFHPQKYMVAAMTRQHNFFLFSFEFDIPITICILFPFFVCNWVFSNENTQSWNYLEILIFFFTKISLFTFIQISFVFFIEIKSLFWFSIKNQFWVNKNKHQIFFSWFKVIRFVNKKSCKLW